MVPIRMIVLEGLVQNTRIFAKIVRSKDYGKEDGLSRLQFKRFWSLAKNDNMNIEASPSLHHLNPSAQSGGIRCDFKIAHTSVLEMKNENASSQSSKIPSTISTHHMEMVVQRPLSQQNRKSTVKTYLNIWRQFNNFVISLDVKPKSWKARTTLYVAYLIDKGRQSASIKSYVSAIKKLLILDGYKWKDSKVIDQCLQNDK